MYDMYVYQNESHLYIYIYLYMYETMDAPTLPKYSRTSCGGPVLLIKYNTHNK